MIRAAVAADALRIAEIYNHYVATSTCTFEEAPVSEAEMVARLQAVHAAGLPWLVSAAGDGRVLAYAYATKWKGRCAYRFAAETSVYVDAAATGQGHGTRLMTRLLERAAALGLRTLISGITLPNASSVALHEKFGMWQCAHFRHVGYKFDRWLDVGYWQLDLQRDAQGK